MSDLDLFGQHVCSYRHSLFIAANWVCYYHFSSAKNGSVVRGLWITSVFQYSDVSRQNEKKDFGGISLCLCYLFGSSDNLPLVFCTLPTPGVQLPDVCTSL